MGSPAIYGIIYKATNTINGKVYIGQTIHSLYLRKKDHLRLCRRFLKNKNTKGIHAFQYAIIKYGETNFIWEEIDKSFSKEDLDEKEIYWIAYYKSFYKKYGYNQTHGGSFGATSIEIRHKVSKKLKGRPSPSKGKPSHMKGKTIEEIIGDEKRSKQFRKNRSNCMKGMVWSQERRLKLSNNKRGYKKSNSHIENQRLGNIVKMIVKYNLDFYSVILDYRKGLTVFELSKKYKIKSNRLHTMLSFFLEGEYIFKKYNKRPPLSEERKLALASSNYKRLIKENMLEMLEIKKKEVIDMYLSKKFTMVDLAKKYNVSYRVIRQFLLSVDPDIINKVSPHINTTSVYKHIIDNNIDKIIDMYEQGISLVDIAKTFNISNHAAISSYIKNINPELTKKWHNIRRSESLSRRNKERANKESIKIVEKNIDNIISLYNEGKTLQQVSEAYGISVWYIISKLKSIKYPIRKGGFKKKIS